MSDSLHTGALPRPRSAVGRRVSKSQKNAILSFVPACLPARAPRLEPLSAPAPSQNLHSGIPSLPPDPGMGDAKHITLLQHSANAV
jgi:hypothetical protein